MITPELKSLKASCKPNPKPTNNAVDAANSAVTLTPMVSSAITMTTVYMRYLDICMMVYFRPSSYVLPDLLRKKTLVSAQKPYLATANKRIT